MFSSYSFHHIKKNLNNSKSHFAHINYNEFFIQLHPTKKKIHHLIPTQIWAQFLHKDMKVVNW